MRISESPEHLKEVMKTYVYNTYDSIDAWLCVKDTLHADCACDNLYRMAVDCVCGGSHITVNVWYLNDERQSTELEQIFKHHNNYFTALKSHRDAIKDILFMLLDDYIRQNTPFTGIEPIGFVFTRADRNKVLEQFKNDLGII